MENEEEKLEKRVNQILLTSFFRNLDSKDATIKSLIHDCETLEDRGFGMLEDANNPGKIDSSLSILSSDGKIYTPEQIKEYWKDRKWNVFKSENKEDNQMYYVNFYYNCFIDNLEYLKNNSFVTLF